jgi:hypothetical protein
VFSFETNAALILKSGFASPTYAGSRLYTSHGDERIGMFSDYHTPTNAIFAISALPPGNTGDSYLFAFLPATKTYEYRKIFVSGARGWSYIASSTSPVALIGNYAYCIGLGRQNGIFKSVMLRVNVTAAMALTNGATLADNTTNWEAFTIPWSISAGGVWESAGSAAAKWQEHCGVMASNGKIALVGSYDALVDGGVTKFSIFDPNTKLFTAAQVPPDSTIAANSWVALPDTGEIMFGLNTSGYTDNILWRYRMP